jgi:5-methyltetrahydrofolate--homocysteine methyltransferase
VQAAGFEVTDLGRNVAAGDFLRAAESGPVVLGISSLMTTTMPRMGKVIEALDKRGLRPGVRVMVGGAPVTQEFARRIGADGWAGDAHGAVLEVERLSGAGQGTGDEG